MNGLTALFDTNIILDFLQKREPFKETADRLFKYCGQGLLRGFVAAQSIPDIFYILRKDYSAKERKDILIGVCDTLEVIGFGKDELMNALLTEVFDDIEDGLQAECAKAMGVAYVVTRNLNDFTHSPVPAILPEDFIKKLKIE